MVEDGKSGTPVLPPSKKNTHSLLVLSPCLFLFFLWDRCPRSVGINRNITTDREPRALDQFQLIRAFFEDASLDDFPVNIKTVLS